jgi:hypothetical protein
MWLFRFRMRDARTHPDHVNEETSGWATSGWATARVAPTFAVLVLCIAFLFTTASVIVQSSGVGATLAVAPPTITHGAVEVYKAPVSHAPASVAIPIGIQDACAAPVVLPGAITADNPTQNGLLVRDGVVGTCGQSGSCAIFDTSPHPYQKFDFTNGTPDAQCVSATIDASACTNTSNVYSAAYTESFNPASICSNYLAGMGFSTLGVFTYSFLVPANASFSVVNSAVYTNALCNSYTLTVRPCSANVSATASLTLTGPARASANANGTAVITYNLSYKNTGNYTAVVPASSVVMTALAQSPGPNLVLLDYGHAGGLIAPGKTITEDVAVIATSSARNLCVPSFYTLTTQLGASASVYQCNWGNPDQQALARQIFTGSLEPSPWLAENRYALSAQAGWNVTVTVNTVYSATTFDPKACISATPQGACLPGLSADDSFMCDFPPKPVDQNRCPMITGTLPATPDGLYYLRITSYSAHDFAGTIGQYRVMIELATPNTALCPTVQVLNNGSRSFLALAGNQPVASAASSAWFSTTAPPVVVSVPPLNARSLLCGRALLPLLNR